MMYVVVRAWDYCEPAESEFRGPYAHGLRRARV